MTLLARAADDSANLGAPSAAVPVNVGGKTLPVLPVRHPDAGAADGQRREPADRGRRGASRADQPGVVTALRYHEGADWTGPRTGHLRTAARHGSPTVTLPDGPGAGWRTVDLPAPVRLTPDTTYVVSYFSADGNYAERRPLLRGGLRLGAAARGRGGGATPTRAQTPAPERRPRPPNYWADVVFAPDDDERPARRRRRRRRTAPPSVAATTAVTATFDEAVDPAHREPSGRSCSVTRPAPRCPATVGYDAGSHTATLTPSAALAAGTVHTAAVTTGVTDTAGNALAAPRTWSFTTAAPGTRPVRSARWATSPADKPTGRGGSGDGPKLAQPPDATALPGHEPAARSASGWPAATSAAALPRAGPRPPGGQGHRRAPTR